MNQNVAIAGISAAVSLASVAANLYISRKARQSNLELEAAKAALKRSESAASAIKDLEVEGERLRMRCWELIGLCEVARKRREHDEPVPRTVFGVTSSSFARQADAFLDKWAFVKTDLPTGIVEILRGVRHDCRREIATVDIVLGTNQTNGGLEPEQAERLGLTLRHLLAGVDRFIEIVSAVRRTTALNEASKGSLPGLSRVGFGGKGVMRT